MAERGRGVLTAEQLEFLTAQRLAVLATGRRDGSPQISTNAYAVDGEDILISTKRYTAKWRNVLRQPRVSLVINEGRKQLVVYGHAVPVERDPERLELSLRVMRRLSGNDELGTDPAQRRKVVIGLDEQQRTVLRITPEKAFIND